MAYSASTVVITLDTPLDFEPSSPNPEFYPFGTTLIRSDQRGEATAVFVSGAAGVYIDLNDITRLSLGARVLHETQIEEASKSLYVMPVFQIDMRL